MIEIDGSVKSGSGTLLRCAVSLATLFGEELHMRNIRAAREKPGLRHQHRQAILACCEVSQGSVEGAALGSMEVWYKPGKRVEGGDYHWDIGTGGSTTMLAMTLLPVACFATSPSTFVISGGLFQDFAPSAYHMKHVFFAFLSGMGIHAELEIKRPGYAEQGGGIIEVRVSPVDGAIKAIKADKRTAISSICGVAICSHLSESKVSERMARECERLLKRSGYSAKIEVVYDDAATHPGAALAIWVEGTGCYLGSDMAGKKGRRAENIGRQVASNLIEDINSGATVDRFLGDQVVLYAALAEGVTEYLIPHMTDHIEANLWLVEQVLGKFGAQAEVTGNRVRVKGIGYLRR
jgi:RNA 3'-terminal phosphate cyclase (ATP)